MKEPIIPLTSSYRDNDGFVFKHEGKIHRLINKSYYPHYELLMNSGLYEELIKNNRLIQHVSLNSADFSNTPCKIILPEQIPFITQPYEWSFNMWKDAAIVTLKIALQALEYGMFLKDATPYNIQFTNGRPVFIDTLSFEKYEEGKPWIAYNQFCECFLAPLLLMHYGHRDMGNLFMSFPNGISNEMLKSLLPFKSKLNFHVFLHVYLKKQYVEQKTETVNNFSKQKFVLLLNSLFNVVEKLSIKKSKSIWNNYYNQTILNEQYLNAKKALVVKFLQDFTFENIIDLGANDGVFSLLLKDKANYIVAIDSDVNCVNELYNNLRLQKIKNIVPLFSSLNAPTPALGWSNAERSSLNDRLNADLVMALALVHHLAIACNVPLHLIANWLHNMCAYLLIEFVPKSDEKVKQLLQNREDIFELYHLESFKLIFLDFFDIVKEQKIGDTERVLFLMKRK